MSWFPEWSCLPFLLSYQDCAAQAYGEGIEDKRHTWALLAVPLVSGTALALWLGTVAFGPVLLGVLGWAVALAARLPVVGSAGRLHDTGRGNVILSTASGVTDEVVRLALVLVGVSGVEPALWAGFGWALAGLAFTIATNRPQQGFPELAAATVFHLGATLLLAAGPWWVLLTATVHTAVNVGYARWPRHRLMPAELFGCAAGVGLLLAGLVTFGRLP